ncbi:hypothetical protein HK405_005856, partial [Cladochytrium tenue]
SRPESKGFGGLAEVFDDGDVLSAPDFVRVLTKLSDGGGDASGVTDTDGESRGAGEHIGPGWTVDDLRMILESVARVLEEAEQATERALRSALPDPPARRGQRRPPATVFRRALVRLLHAVAVADVPEDGTGGGVPAVEASVVVPRIAGVYGAHAALVEFVGGRIDAAGLHAAELSSTVSSRVGTAEAAASTTVATGQAMSEAFGSGDWDTGIARARDELLNMVREVAAMYGVRETLAVLGYLRKAQTIGGADGEDDNEEEVEREEAEFAWRINELLSVFISDVVGDDMPSGESELEGAAAGCVLVNPVWFDAAVREARAAAAGPSGDALVRAVLAKLDWRAAAPPGAIPAAEASDDARVRARDIAFGLARYLCGCRDRVFARVLDILRRGTTAVIAASQEDELEPLQEARRCEAAANLACLRVHEMVTHARTGVRVAGGEGGADADRGGGGGRGSTATTMVTGTTMRVVCRAALGVLHAAVRASVPAAAEVRSRLELSIPQQATHLPSVKSENGSAAEAAEAVADAMFEVELPEGGAVTEATAAAAARASADAVRVRSIAARWVLWRRVVAGEDGTAVLEEFAGAPVVVTMDGGGSGRSGRGGDGGDDGHVVLGVLGVTVRRVVPAAAGGRSVPVSREGTAAEGVTVDVEAAEFSLGRRDAELVQWWRSMADALVSSAAEKILARLQERVGVAPPRVHNAGGSGGGGDDVDGRHAEALDSARAAEDAVGGDSGVDVVAAVGAIRATWKESMIAGAAADVAVAPPWLINGRTGGGVGHQQQSRPQAAAAREALREQQRAAAPTVASSLPVTPLAAEATTMMGHSARRRTGALGLTNRRRTVAATSTMVAIFAGGGGGHDEDSASAARARRDAALGLSGGAAGSPADGRRLLAAASTHGRADGRLFVPRVDERNAFEATTATTAASGSAALQSPSRRTSRRFRDVVGPGRVAEEVPRSTPGTSAPTTTFAAAAGEGPPGPAPLPRGGRATRHGANAEWRHATAATVQPAAEAPHMFASEAERLQPLGPLPDWRDERQSRERAAREARVRLHVRDKNAGDMVAALLGPQLPAPPVPVAEAAAVATAAARWRAR